MAEETDFTLKFSCSVLPNKGFQEYLRGKESYMKRMVSEKFKIDYNLISSEQNPNLCMTILLFILFCFPNVLRITHKFSFRIESLDVLKE